MPYEFLPHDDMKIRATGGTRAGLMIAALHGMFAAASVKTDENDETRVERTFDVKAADFASLITAFLEEAIRLSSAGNEVYDDVQFELATDKVVRGRFSGRPALSFGTPVAGVVRESLMPQRNVENQWEAVITFAPA